MADYSSSEVKSGIFITFSLVLFLVLIFMIGGFTQGEVHEYKVRFGYVNGLEKNAPVYFAGHEVGKVENIEILAGDEKPVLVTVGIDPHIQLRQDTKSYIDTLGMMGEKFVEFTPGTINTNVLTPGAEIIGVDPIPMYSLVMKMNLMADRMDELTQSLNPLVTRMDNLLMGSQEDIHRMLANFHEVSQNLRDMTRDLKFRPWRLIRKG